MSVAGNQNFICLFASHIVTKTHFPSWANFTSASDLNASELWLSQILWYVIEKDKHLQRKSTLICKHVI